MDKKDEFELEFDFEKEYGISPENLMGDDYDSGEDFDIDLDNMEILTPKKVEESAEAVEYDDDDFSSPEIYQLMQDYEPHVFGQEPVQEQAVEFEAPEAAQEFPVELPEEVSLEDLPEELPAETMVDEELPDAQAEQPLFRPRERRAPQRRQNPLKARPQAEQELQPQQEVQPENPAPQEPPTEAPANPRRRKRSQMRIIKEDYLPVGIAGLALLLCLIFIIGGVVRTIKNNDERKKNEIAASEQAASEAARLEEEARTIREEAAVMAAGYDFDGAIALIDTFSGNIGSFQELLDDRSKYTQMQGQMVEITDFTNIPNLSFHVLIADSGTAFNSEPYGPKYLQNFVTIDEFSKILEQLYENGYVLVNFDDFIEEIPDGTGDVTFQTKSIKLPTGKKPIMITETLVNYLPYMVDGDDDGQPDADGDGFACKLVVKDGKITSERVNADGETVYGAYDLVPILEEFIEEHPDFSYRGARATLAVTGSEGIFGYRLKDEDDIKACKELVQALRDQGYLLACNSYQNISYATINATDIQADLEKWTKNIVPVIGDVDILVYALGSDIADYNGSKYNVMANAGFNYFISNTTNGVPTTDVNVDFVRQYRIMVTGSMMVNSPEALADFFTVSHILSNDR